MRLPLTAPLHHPLIALLLAIAAGCAQAGRPLTVDDANVNEAGSGHVEVWQARAADGLRTWTVAPAYAPWAGLELGLAWARAPRVDSTQLSLQAKLQLSAPQPGGCHHAVVAGASHPGAQRGATPYAVGILSCPRGPGAAHVNLGISRAPGGPSLPTLGVAWEQALGAGEGTMGHIEWLVQRDARPTLDIGLRQALTDWLQLDGHWGRSGGASVFSLGFKVQF